MAKSLFEELGGKHERPKLHTPICSQAAGSILTLPTSTDRRRNALNGS